MGSSSTGELVAACAKDLTKKFPGSFAVRWFYVFVRPFFPGLPASQYLHGVWFPLGTRGHERPALVFMR